MTSTTAPSRIATRLSRWMTALRGRIRLLVRGLHPTDRALISRIRAEKLTYLSRKKLAGIAATCRDIEKRGLPGRFVEAGCALGGSAILVASLKSPDRPLLLYDVFGMIPPPTDEDTPDVHERYRTIVEGESRGIGGDRYYGYQENLRDTVRSNLERFGVDLEAQSVTLVQGLVQDTLVVDGPVAFAHIDVDWYDPVRTCLERVFPDLVPGGSIIVDDYHDWGGCRKATDEFLRRVEDEVELDESAGSLRITRT